MINETVTEIKVEHKERESSSGTGGGREGGNEVKGCEGIPSFFSAVNHSAGARDTKEPVCEF